MLNLRVRPLVNRVVDPLARGLLRAGVVPDVVTVVGTVGAVASALGLFSTGHFFTGTALVALFVLTDLLDGAMARARGTGSRFGAFLDSTMDRFADAAIFGGLVLWYAGGGHDRRLLALALFCLVTGSITSYAKARAEGLGMTCNVGIAERAERLIVVLLGTLLVGLGAPTWVLGGALGLLAAASAITVVQRLVEVHRQAALASS